MLSIPRTAQGGDRQANRETPRTFRLVFWALALALPVLYALFRLLLVFLEGRGYSPGDAARAFAWLLPGMLFMGVDQIISGDLAGRGKQLWNTLVASSMLGVNIALDLWWIPRYGIAGAAVATSAAYIAGCLITLGIFQSFSKASWRDLFIPTREDINLLLFRLKR
jgi:O-antigen/teichoic acid export membrane protein